MNKKKLILVLTLLGILSLGIYLYFIKGIYVVVTNANSYGIENIEVSCRGFSQTFALKPTETKKIKLKLNQSGDNSLTLSYINNGTTISESFSYFENFLYKGKIVIQLKNDKIKLISDTVKPSLL